MAAEALKYVEEKAALSEENLADSDSPEFRSTLGQHYEAVVAAEFKSVRATTRLGILGLVHRLGRKPSWPQPILLAYLNAFSFHFPPKVRQFEPAAADLKQIGDAIRTLAMPNLQQFEEEVGEQATAASRARAAASLGLPVDLADDESDMANQMLRQSLDHCREVLQARAGDESAAVAMTQYAKLLLQQHVPLDIGQQPRPRPTWSVVGHTGAGKSTFLNVLLAQYLFPMSAEPCTSLPFRIYFGPVTQAKFSPELVQLVPDLKAYVDLQQVVKAEKLLGALKELTEACRADFVKLAAVALRRDLWPCIEVNSPFLQKSDIELIDTPGPNDSSLPLVRAVFQLCLHESDGLLLLLAAASLSTTEIQLMADAVAPRGLPLVTIINKCDGQQMQPTQFTAKMSRQLMERAPALHMRSCAVHGTSLKMIMYHQHRAAAMNDKQHPIWTELLMEEADMAGAQQQLEVFPKAVVIEAWDDFMTSGLSLMNTQHERVRVHNVLLLLRRYHRWLGMFDDTARHRSAKWATLRKQLEELEGRASALLEQRLAGLTPSVSWKNLRAPGFWTGYETRGSAQWLELIETWEREAQIDMSKTPLNAVNAALQELHKSMEDLNKDVIAWSPQVRTLALLDLVVYQRLAGQDLVQILWSRRDELVVEVTTTAGQASQAKVRTATWFAEFKAAATASFKANLRDLVDRRLKEMLNCVRTNMNLVEAQLAPIRTEAALAAAAAIANRDSAQSRACAHLQRDCDRWLEG